MAIPHPKMLWYTQCPLPTALDIAAQNCWLDESFAEYGIEIKRLEDSSLPYVRESTFDHRLANNFRQGGNIPAIWSSAQGRGTRLIGLSWTDEYQAIIALPESGIRSMSDLRGRRLGLPKRLREPIDFNRAAALRAYLTALSLNGMDEKAVELVDLPVAAAYVEEGATVSNSGGFSSLRRHIYSAEMFALVRGEVDAIFVKGSLGAEVAALINAIEIIDLGRHPDPLVRANNGTPRTLTVDSEMADNHPELIDVIINLAFRGSAWAKMHPNETVTFLARTAKTSEQWVRYAFGPNVHRHLGIDLRDESILALQDIADFLLRWDFIPSAVSVNDWIDASPLERYLSGDSTFQKSVF